MAQAMYFYFSLRPGDAAYMFAHLAANFVQQCRSVSCNKLWSSYYNK